MSGNVVALCRKVWEARAQGRLSKDHVMLAQQLYVAVAADIAVFTDMRYDPESDRQVMWLRDVIREVRSGEKGDIPTDACVGWLLGYVHIGEAIRCGKNLAAGVDA